MKKTIIISAFPACGKSYIFNNNSKGRVVLDSDSSNFSWKIDGDGQKVRNEAFPANYIQHIQENIGKADIIFVSSHLQVREVMTAAGIDFVTVYPESDLKEEWLGRCFLRGNDFKFMTFLAENWDKFMNDVYDEPCGKKLYRLCSKQHLSDIIERIIIDNTPPAQLQNIREALSEAYCHHMMEYASAMGRFKETYTLSEGVTANISNKGPYVKIVVDLGNASKYRHWDFIQEDIEGLIIWSGRSSDIKTKGKEIAAALGVADIVLKEVVDGREYDNIDFNIPEQATLSVT